MLLLLPTATYRADDFLRAARSLGVDVVVATDRRQSLASAAGDAMLTVDLGDPAHAAEAIASLAGRRPLDAVIAVDEQGVEAAAAAALRLGLRGNPPASVSATRDKALLRRALGSARVAQPAYAVVDEGEAVDGAVARVGLPCVVKPRRMSASRGVIRADTVEEARAAASRTRRIVACETGGPAASLVVERYLEGGEVALEGLLEAGTLRALALFDKPDPLTGPFFEETIYVTPSRLPGGLQERVVALAQEACLALGLLEGPVHAELRLTRDGPVCLEVASRSIGGHCSRMLRFATGATLEELILARATGMPLPPSTLTGAAGVMMLPIRASGVLAGVEGQEAARSTDGIVGLEIAIAPGRRVVALPEGDRYLGFLFARGSSAAFVERALRTAEGHLDVRLEERRAARAVASCR